LAAGFIAPAQSVRKPDRAVPLFEEVLEQLLIAIFALLPRAAHLAAPPTGAQVPQQPTADEVQLTKLKMAPAPCVWVLAGSSKNGLLLNH